MSFMVERQKNMSTIYGEPDTPRGVCPVRRGGAGILLVKAQAPDSLLYFKRIFGDESNKKVLISLLNAILHIKIREIALFPQELPREAPLLKGAVLDIVAELDNKTRIDIEMQTVFHSEYLDRILYYWAELFTRQPIKGDTHYTLKKTISITILGDGKDFFPHAHSIYKLMECHGDTVHTLTDKEEFHFVGAHVSNIQQYCAVY